MVSACWKFARSSRLLFSNVANVATNNIIRHYSSKQPHLYLRTTPSFSFVRAFSAGKLTPEQEAKNLLEAAAKEAAERDKKNQEKWKYHKGGLIIIGGIFGVFGAYVAYELGSPEVDEQGVVIQDEFSHLSPLIQFYRRFMSKQHYYTMMIQKPSREKLLPDPMTYPYIQPTYTLVLEVTDLLVHPDWTYQTGWRFKKRPGVDYFLEQVAAPLFEVVVYTAEPGMVIFPVIDSLDPNNTIWYRLVRDATHFLDGAHVKDLDHLNRDLSKVIVVDWNPESVKLHPRNALLIPRWRGSDSDATLIDLAAFLRTIANNKVEDVRDVLEYYQQFDDPIAAFRENQRKVMEQKELDEKELKDKSTTQRWRPSFFQPRG